MKRPNSKRSDQPSEKKITGPPVGLFERLVSVLPNITQPIQLLGLAITVAAFLIVRLVSPDNIAAMVSAGMIGIGLIIFATLFLIIPQLSKQHRALFVLLLFFIYLAASIYLVRITYDLIQSGAQRVTEESLKVVGANLVAREQDISSQIEKTQRRVAELQLRRTRSESAIEIEQIDSIISNARQDIADLRKLLEGVRARQLSLKDTQQLIGNVVAELNRIQREYANFDPEASRVSTAAADAARGEFDQAQRVLEQRLISTKQTEGRTKLALGEIAEVKGDLMQALQYYRDAHQLLTANVVAAEHHARVSRLLGNFKEARALYEEALELVGPRDSDSRQWLLTNYAVCLWHLGHKHTEDARKQFQMAYAGTSPLTLPRALAAQNFGAFLWDMDELASAEDKLREAHDIYLQLDVTKQFLRNETLNNLGGVLLARGKYFESRQFLEASRTLIAETLGVTNLAYSLTISNLVANHSRFGDPFSAEEHVQFLLKREREGSLVGYELGAILGAVAEHFSEKMDFKTVDEVLRRALGIVSRVGDVEATKGLKARLTMKQIEALLDAGLAGMAANELTKNTEFLRTAVMPNTRGEIQLERIRGRISLARSEWDSAISHLEKAVALANSVVGPDHPSLVWSLAPLAKSYRGAQQPPDGTGVSDKAKRISEEAMRIAKGSLSPNSRIWVQLTDFTAPSAPPNKS